LSIIFFPVPHWLIEKLEDEMSGRNKKTPEKGIFEGE